MFYVKCYRLNKCAVLCNAFAGFVYLFIITDWLVRV